MKQPGFNGKYPIGRFFFVAHLYPIPSMGLVYLPCIYHKNQQSRWWFQIFFNVHPYLVKISHLKYFSEGLKPPTSVWYIYHTFAIKINHSCR